MPGVDAFLLLAVLTTPTDQSLVEVAMRQGGFALAALVLFYGMKYLWQRFVKNDDARLKELNERLASQDREIKAASKRREDEIAEMRERELQARGDLQNTVDVARKTLEDERTRGAASLIELHQQLAKINEVRVDEAMQVVRAAESLKDTNDILEKLLHALAERARAAETLASRLVTTTLGEGRATHEGVAGARPAKKDER